MPHFSNAIVRTPCRNMIHGLTGANLGTPHYDKALNQHQAYIKTLETCGLEVTVLPPDDDYPDSVFVEDTALLTPKCAVLCNPGAATRKGEAAAIKEAIEPHYKNIETIEDPGTVDGGDIMMVADFYYIGLSERTNANGAEQMLKILRSYGMDGTTLPLTKMLHLKSGVSYLENNKLLITGEFLQTEVFGSFELLRLPDCESYAANSLWLNGTVLLPGGFDGALAKVSESGYKTIILNVSEFRKLDGGLSCLSLRF